MITDVIYSSKTTSEEEQATTGSKEEYERMKVSHSANEIQGTFHFVIDLDSMQDL